MVEAVPEGTHGNVRALMGVLRDKRSSVAHPQAVGSSGHSDSLGQRLGSTSALHRPALPSSEMSHSMRNGHNDLGSRKHISVLHAGGFAGDVTLNEK